MSTNEINVLVLAYLGDTIYEDYVRKFLIGIGLSNVNELQKAATSYVSARAQARYLTKLMEQNQLREEELSIVRRARNYKTTSHPKNCDIVTYKYATGLEALIGYLELEQQQGRIREIMKFILEDKEC